MESYVAMNNREIQSLYKAVATNNWKLAQLILQDNSSLLASETTKQTLLCAAVAVGSSKQFVQHLARLMTADSLKEASVFGRTALHIAALTGNTDAAGILVKRSSELMYKRDLDGEAPLHLAARNAHEKTVRYLLSVTRNEDPELSGEPGARLLKHLIIAHFYDIALEVLERCQALLSDPRLLEESLEILATRPEAFARHSGLWFCLSAPRHCSRISLQCMKATRPFEIPQSTDRAVFKYPHAIDLLGLLIGHILESCWEESTMILGRQLCSAARYGNYEVVVHILATHPVSFSYADENGNGIFEIAALHRQETVFNLVYQFGSLEHFLLPTKDRNGNNILHFAARRQRSSVSSAAIQVQRDLHWFKDIERNVPPSFRSQINNKGKTPREVFAEEHKEPLKQADEWMKKTADSCTVVAALVVTVAFAAAFTVPGGNDSSGIPTYLTDASFMTFAISDTLGLVSSTTSLLMFLSILSSRFSAGNLLNTGQYMRLSIGLVTLFFSIASMLVTFTASLQIVLGHRVKWIAVPTGILASVTMILFAWLQFPLLVEIVYSTFRPVNLRREDEKMQK